MPYLTYTHIQQQLSTKYIRRVPLFNKEKLKDALMALLLPPPVLFIVFLSRVGTASLQPVFGAVVIAVVWYLFFMVGHRSISEKRFTTKLTTDEQQQRLRYDSMWYYLLRSGYGFYCTICWIWGIVEFGIAKKQVEVALLLLVVDLVAAVILVINRRWLVLIMLEEYRKHRKVGALVSIVLGLFATAPILSGVANMLRVTTTPESRDILVVPFMVLLNLFSLSFFVLALLGTLITIAHYQNWKSK